MKSLKGNRTWSALFLMFFLASGSGCVQPHVISQEEYIASNEVTGAYDGTDTGYPQVVKTTPPTVTAPSEQEQWKLSLYDAIRIGMEQNKRIRFLGYLPAEAGTEIERSLASFDPILQLGTGWRRTDFDSNSLFDDPSETRLFGGSTGPAGENASLFKRNVTGATTSVAWASDRSRTSPGEFGTRFDPLSTTRFSFRVEQPLLRGAGVGVNRAPILIARSNQQQVAREFEAEVQAIVRDIEKAYWDLFFSYRALYSQEAGLKLTLTLWQAEKAKLEEGAGSRPDVVQARERYEEFRDSRIQALDAVLQAESFLREILGLPPQDFQQIIPSENPIVAEFLPDWEESLSEALHLRPDLQALRLASRSRELQLDRDKNAVLPELNLILDHSSTGNSDTFGESIEEAIDDPLEDWTVGVSLRVPLGQRAAYADVRRSELSLTRQRATLQALENSVYYQLQRAYRSISTQYESLKIRQARKQAAGFFLESQLEVFRQGKGEIFVVLEAQSRYVDSLSDEALAIAQYNQSLADWEFAKGTILRTNNVVVEESESQPISQSLFQYRTRQRNRAIPISLPVGGQADETHVSLEDPTAGMITPLYEPTEGGHTTQEPVALPRTHSHFAPTETAQEAIQLPEPAPNLDTD